MLNHKTIKIILTITAVCLISLAQAEEKEGSKIELIPVYEKTFDDTIVDVIFDTATVSIEEAKKMGWKEEAFKGMKSNENTKIIYPKVVITKKKEEGKAYYHYGATNTRNYGIDDLRAIKFYNKMGRLFKVINAGIFKQAVDLIRSPNGRYLCITKWPSERNYDFRGGILYNSDGRKVWEIDKYTPIAISDEGYAVAVYADWEVPPEPGGKFYLFDDIGKLIKTIENPDSAHLVARFAKFSDDGEWAIVVFKKETFPPTYITLIKKTGEIVWEKYFPDCRVSARSSEFAIIPNIGVCGIWDNQLEKGTGTFNNTEIYFIDWQGNLKWNIPLGIRGNMIVDASKEGSKIYIVTTDGYLWCVNVQNGRFIWTYKESWAPELSPLVKYNPNALSFREMRIMMDNIYLISGEWMPWRSSILSIFNTNTGTLLKKMEFLNEKISLPFAEQYLTLIKETKGEVVIFTKEVLK